MVGTGTTVVQPCLRFGRHFVRDRYSFGHTYQPGVRSTRARPNLYRIANTTMGIGSLLAPLVGAMLALLGYNLLFAVSAMFGLAALIMLATVMQEPRRQAILREHP